MKGTYKKNFLKKYLLNADYLQQVLLSIAFIICLVFCSSIAVSATSATEENSSSNTQTETTYTVNDTNPSTSSDTETATNATNSDTSSGTETDNAKSDTSTNTKTTGKTSKKNKTVKITISAAGDCTLGVDSRYNNTFSDYYNKNGDAYFFKKVKSLFSKDDLTIVNFEGTLTTSTARANKTFTFKAPAKYVKILKKGSVEVVNLANNHTMDFGSQGFKDTKNTLKKNKISYCEGNTIAYKTVKGVKIAFVGFNALNGVTEQQVKNTIQTAKKKKAKIIIASFHWGIEKEYYPNTRQKTLGRCAISSGASLVLGHHPHRVQGVEKYKGRYIVYSLGNFSFGGHTNPDDKDALIFQQTFYVKNGKLQKKNDAKIVPCSISSVSYTNNYQPKILTGSEKKRLIKKMNTLSKGMNTSFENNGKVK